MPLPASGTVDPEAMAGVATDVSPNFYVIGDQTGDGLPDVWSFTSAVLGTPVTFVDGTITSTVQIDVDPNVEGMTPTPFDFDGDAIADFLGLEATLVDAAVEGVAPLQPYTGAAVFTTSGGAALSTAAYDTAWDLEGGEMTALVHEDGVAVGLVVLDGNVVVVELGGADRVY